MKTKASTGFTRRLLTTAAALIGLAPVAFAQAPQTFFVLNNPNDPMFNQLLGINNGNVIVGYFGDGRQLRITAMCWFHQITTHKTSTY
jgi:hypothetical protein